MKDSRALPGAFTLLLMALVTFAGAAAAADPAGTSPEEMQVEIEAIDRNDHAPRTLRFLHENRAFLRSQLDRLRMTVHWKDLSARPLSARQEWLRSLGARLDAANDSLDLQRAAVDRRQLLARIEELAAVEDQLDALDSLLAEQAARLVEIDADYTGRQETALALLATGLPEDGESCVALVIDAIDGETVRVRLDERMRQALATGAVAELLHDFVEPRALQWSLRAEYADGRVVDLGHVSLQPTRDRLTFVELDLRQPPDDSGRRPAHIWIR